MHLCLSNKGSEMIFSEGNFWVKDWRRGDFQELFNQGYSVKLYKLLPQILGEKINFKIFGGME